MLVSVSLSNEEVGSSHRRIGDPFKIARAMATLCFSPPDLNRVEARIEHHTTQQQQQQVSAATHGLVHGLQLKYVQFQSSFTDNGIVTSRKTRCNGIMNLCLFRGQDYVVPRRFQITILDIVSNRFMKQNGILWYNCNGLLYRFSRQVGYNILSTEQNLPLGRIVKSIEQSQNCAL
jgi:hypothetical protein